MSNSLQTNYTSKNRQSDTLTINTVTSIKPLYLFYLMFNLAHLPSGSNITLHVISIRVN